MKNIHILSTKKPSRLVKNNLGLIRVTDDFTQKDLDFIKAEFVNIYITSDEEIKDVRPHKGKWQLETGRILNKFPNYLTDLSECKLVIMTTDQDLIKDEVQSIDDEFLEWFVKNPTYEEVYIIKQYKQVNQDNPITKGSTALMFSHYEIHLLKATQQMIDEWNLIYCKLNNRKIPTKEEPKQETLEEVAERLLNLNELDSFRDYHYKQELYNAFIVGIKYQQKNNYNEEDMKKAFYYGYCCENKYGIEVTFNDWFIKFKNK